MFTDGVTLERLERQRALIDAVTSRVETRSRAGEPVGLSLSLLRQEKRLYRRLLGHAPLPVLERHALSARFT